MVLSEIKAQGIKSWVFLCQSHHKHIEFRYKPFLNGIE